MLTTAIAGTALFCALFIGGAALLNASTTAREQAHLRLAEVTEANALRVEQRIQQAVQQTDQLISIATTDFDFASCSGNQKQLAAHEAKVVPTFRNSVITSPMKSGWIHMDPRIIRGVFHVSFYKDQEGNLKRSPVYNVYQSGHTEDDWFRLAMEAGAVWTEPFYWPRWDTQMITYSKRVELDGQVLGVAGSDFFLDDFTKELEALKVYESGYVALVDKDFDILYHPESGRKSLLTQPGGIGDDVVARIAIDRDGSGIIDFKLDGHPQVLSYRRLSNGWILIVVPNEQVVYAPQRSLIWAILFVISGGVILAVVLALFLGRVIANPFNAMLTRLKDNLQELQEKANGEAKEGEPSLVRLLFERSIRPVAPALGIVPDETSLWAELTEGERKVYRLLCQELPDSKIAETLFISKATVKFHVRNILHKAEAPNRKELIKKIRK